MEYTLSTRWCAQVWIVTQWNLSGTKYVGGGGGGGKTGGVAVELADFFGIVKRGINFIIA